VKACNYKQRNRCAFQKKPALINILAYLNRTGIDALFLNKAARC
jgi:hypothetical protein